MNHLVRVFEFVGLHIDPVVTESVLVTNYVLHFMLILDGPDKSGKLFYMYLHGLYVWPIIYILLGLKFIAQRDYKACGRTCLCGCVTECCTRQKNSIIVIAFIINFLYNVILVFMTSGGLPAEHYVILGLSFFVLLHDFFLSLLKLILFLSIVLILLTALTIYYPFYLLVRCLSCRDLRRSAVAVHASNGESGPSLAMQGRSFFRAFMGPQLNEERE